jgi:hypothetical protein
MKCKFCGRRFPCDQSLYAHFKHCKAYREHKPKKQTACLGQAVPKAASRGSPCSYPAWLNTPDPMRSFQPFFEAMGVPPPPRAQETPQERRRILLQSAKGYVVDRHPWLNGSAVTVQMRADAKLAIDHELRDERLEEFSAQEVTELAEGIRDRVYATFLRGQEQAARRTCEAEGRKQRDEADAHRKAQERTKKKAAYLEEAGRRTTALMKSRSLPLPERLRVREEVQIQLDAVLTGAESPADAYAAMEALLKARIAEWNIHDETVEAKRHEEWRDIALVMAGVATVAFLLVKAPQVLLWIMQVLSPG